MSRARDPRPPDRRLPDWCGARVLVTGAGGFLGSALCRALLDRGAIVHGTVRRGPAPAGVVQHRWELADRRAWVRVFAEVRPGLVFHLAAPVRLERDPRAWPELLETIALATHRVALSCLEAGTRLVVAGTCEEYGDGPAPFREDQAAMPVSPYSAAKAAASAWVHGMARTAGLRATVVRPFLTYGPGQRGERLVPSAIRAALAGRPFPMTDGRQTREFNYVDDTVRGILLASSEAAAGRLLNLGGGPELPVLEVARRVFALCGADPGLVRPGELPRRPGEVDRFFGDHALARELLGHRPEVDIDLGLSRTIDAWRARG